MKVVHVAGTKGKGSTAAFLSNILRAEVLISELYANVCVWEQKISQCQQRYYVLLFIGLRKFWIRLWCMRMDSRAILRSSRLLHLQSLPIRMLISLLLRLG